MSAAEGPGAAEDEGAAPEDEVAAPEHEGTVPEEGRGEQGEPGPPAASVHPGEAAGAADAQSALEPDAATTDAGSAEEGSAERDGGVEDAAADACGVACSGSTFTPARFSRTDRSPCLQVSPSGFELEIVDWGPCGVRSDRAVAPGEGVFYFEAQRLVGRYKGGSLGIATAQAALTESAGASAQSAGALATGVVASAGGSCSGALDPLLPSLSFVLDYRAATPVLHMLQASPDGLLSVRASCSMLVSAPVHIFYSGERAKVGYELAINTGADTTNLPFLFGTAHVRMALAAVGQAGAGEALVMGFGATHAEPLDLAPNLTVSPDRSVPLGQAVALTASASDPEEGVLDAQIEWLDLASPHHAPVRARGPSFAFTPSSIGVHPIVVSVVDRVGRRSERTVRVGVSGALPQHSPVQLVPDAASGAGIVLSPDGLSVSFQGEGKQGIRANQGIYGSFRYFEVHRDSAIRNMGMGLVTADGALNPYEPARVPWSCSLNVLRGFWINLIDAGDWAHEPSDTDYGFAVDYRGEHPRVHILIRGVVQTTLQLDDVWVPLYPMLYGNPPDAPLVGSDMTINFGARPFVFDPRASLTAAGIDASELELGWGPR
jgi:hypothetical protein